MTQQSLSDLEAASEKATSHLERLNRKIVSYAGNELAKQGIRQDNAIYDNRLDYQMKKHPDYDAYIQAGRDAEEAYYQWEKAVKEKANEQ